MKFQLKTSYKKFKRVEKQIEQNSSMPNERKAERAKKYEKKKGNGRRR